MLEIKKRGNSGKKIFGNYVFELVSIMVLYIGSMVFALCWFSQPFDEKLELITVTGYATTETTTTTTNTTTTTTTETTTMTTTTTSETTTTEETTTTTTTTATDTMITTTEYIDPEPKGVSKDNLKLLGTFKGTYYSGGTKGGSGRRLIDCKSGGYDVKGSVACRYVYEKYKYNLNGRTKVYIECASVPSMSGWYYVDDCCGSRSVVDFYYSSNSRCQFKNAGVISVKIYI